MFNVVPTAFEIALVAGILAVSYGPQYAALVGTTIVTYTAYTLAVTQWRQAFRQVRPRPAASRGRTRTPRVSFRILPYPSACVRCPSESVPIPTQEMNRNENAGNTAAVDSLLNYETVKYFNNESHEVLPHL